MDNGLLSTLSTVPRNGDPPDIHAHHERHVCYPAIFPPPKSITSFSRLRLQNPTISAKTDSPCFWSAKSITGTCISITEMNGGDNRRPDRRDLRAAKKQRFIRTAEEELDFKLGFDLFSEGEKRLGWLLTFASVGQFCHHSHHVCTSSSIDIYWFI